MDKNSNGNSKMLGIVTLHGYHNYGNKLQNYALQEAVKSLGFEVSTIVNKRDRRLLGKVKSVILFPFIRIREYFKGKNEKETFGETHKETTDTRTMIFKLFSKEKLSEKFININSRDSRKTLDKYNYFITGSDQVWNPVYINRMNDYFLEFAAEEKRISYAPSFGVSEVKPEYMDNYKQWISGIHKLSVREDDGAKIIKELTGREAPVLVDPTLLLTKEKWMSIAKEASNKPKEKYLLTYFLGGVSDNYKKQIKDIAKDNNLEVINLGDIKEKETYKTGPSEFVDYINSCSIFCTDSFHGAVFSILFEKPFIVYERMSTSLSMFSRIETLLNKFNLESRKAKNIKSNEDVFDIDYSHVPPILEGERKKSFDYLKEALNIKDEE